MRPNPLLLIMGELQSLPYNTTTTSLACWDLQNIGFLNSDMSLVMDGTCSSPFFSSLQSDFSTGYLEDAFLEFNDRSKRRRFALSNNNADQTNGFAKSCWNENCGWDTSETEKLSCISHITSSVNGVQETQENEETSVQETTIDSSSSSCKDSPKTKSTFHKQSLPYPVSGNQEDKKSRKKRVIKRVVYPFALIKPGGIEGDITINDINERILMPPTRPLRHPVGDFACRPCVSAAGFGLSGKAVVALTRIHTQGRGTVTIIRTKG